mmetsp:Transcript_18923/g.28548  ORF Transcript_18923/g.28548 Transcript_18923/m.28548 type:complete len:91 (+) Transcript_18923:178-450(+)
MNPTENDVLSGRGAWFNQHPGNVQFRKMIDDQKVRQSQHYPFCPISIDEFYGPSFNSMTFQMTNQCNNIYPPHYFIFHRLPTRREPRSKR